MKVVKNPKWTEEQHIQFKAKVIENNGYCPCKLLKTEDNKCMCKEFLESEALGECHCGRFVKTEI